MNREEEIEGSHGSVNLLHPSSANSIIASPHCKRHHHHIHHNGSIYESGSLNLQSLTLLLLSESSPSPVIVIFNKEISIICTRSNFVNIYDFLSRKRTILFHISKCTSLVIDLNLEKKKKDGRYKVRRQNIHFLF